MLLVSTRNHPEGWGSRVSAVGCGPIRSPTPGRLAGAPRAPFSPGFGGNVRLLIAPRISWAAASRSSPQLTAFHGKVRDVPVVVRTRVKMTFSVTGGRFSSALEKTVTPPHTEGLPFCGRGDFHRTGSEARQTEVCVAAGRGRRPCPAGGSRAGCFCRNGDVPCCSACAVDVQPGQPGGNTQGPATGGQPGPVGD